MSALGGADSLEPATAGRVSGRPLRPETRPHTHPAPPRSHASRVGIVIADSQSLYADLLARAINHEPDLRCHGHAATPQKARTLITSQRPDIVVLEIELAGFSLEVGLHLARETIRRSWSPRVIILTQHLDPRLIKRAAAIGASALLSKGGHVSAIFESIRNGDAHTITIDPRFLHDRAMPPGRDCQTRLTPRENDALAALARAGSTRQAAINLNIASSTMASHLKSVRKKLHCHSNLELIAAATRIRLVHPT